MTGALPFFNVNVAVASRSSGRTSGYCSLRRCDGSFDTALHGNVQLPLPTAMGQVALTGQRGVALFFIVSAFTLFLSYDNRKEERHPTRNFFIRRFFRLAPMAFLSWRYIEEPGIRLGRRIIAHFEGVEIRTKDVAFFPPAISATAEGNSPDAQF